MNNKKSPIISVIVPCYNAEKYVRQTLDCLLKQTVDNWECVIVNDGSKDGSLSILKEFESKDSRFRVIDKVNEGPAIARNTAIANSDGKYILPLDADDILDPTYIEKAVSYLESHPEIKLVYSKCDFFGDRKGAFELADYDYKRQLWFNSITCTAVYRRSDYDLTQGYNPNMKAVYEDWDFWLSLLNEGDKVYKIPEVLFYYRIHGPSRNSQGSEVFQVALRTLVSNHIEKYKPYMEDIVQYYNDAQAFKAVSQSLSFRVGRILLMPLSYCRNILSGFKK